MSTLRLCGLDPSLRNWGIAHAVYHMATGKLSLAGLDVIQPVLNKGKQVRQTSMDLDSAKQLHEAAYNAAVNADVVFVEVPIGSQSARAMASYGVCVGVLGSLQSAGIPLFTVTPTEVKMATVGSKTATKEEMINWAVANYPGSEWPIVRAKGSVTINASKAEHMADALGSIQAGIALASFKQLLSIYRTGKTYGDLEAHPRVHGLLRSF